ncbi:DUF1127 domain-containing protein [Defluviimonas sp. D31]|uniref:DUF1127 domain-containing protein n=1 Tax=Defluviimonas sp. D31 TaxID=3083253 RepID=UPI00296FB262|nr:DUF1127 domain-containing protein [Defluviimonas sp. D31]MDW4550299.1 DUF1127 domain-containing protein [Defluviimonas sp. D31]
MERALAHRLPRLRRRLIDRLRLMLEVRRQRQALADLNDYLLKDIGVSADEARREAGRPAWDVPNYWRR